MLIKDYMEWRQISDKEAAEALKVTEGRIRQLKRGGPAGRKLGGRIVEWSDGAVTLEDALFPKNKVA